MKKLICLLAAAALLVCCALPAFAEASGVSRADYTITAYSVDATLHENNTVTQTERITVDFAVPSRGIYRVLPVALWVEKDTADGPQEMAYRARVRDLAVTGEGQTARPWRPIPKTAFTASASAMRTHGSQACRPMS